jgi:hypothetical protein
MTILKTESNLVDQNDKISNFRDPNKHIRKL